MADNSGRTHFVGVDLGGTKILSGVFDARLRLLGQAKTSTKSQRGPEVVIERVARCVRESILQTALCLSFGFGGQNAAIAFARCQGLRESCCTY